MKNRGGGTESVGVAERVLARRYSPPGVAFRSHNGSDDEYDDDGTECLSMVMD